MLQCHVDLIDTIIYVYEPNSTNRGTMIDLKSTR